MSLYLLDGAKGEGYEASYLGDIRYMSSFCLLMDILCGPGTSVMGLLPSTDSI